MIPIRGEGDTELQPLTLTPVELFDLFMELDVHSEFLQRLMAGWDRMFDRLLPNCESYGYTERLAQLERQGS